MVASGQFLIDSEARLRSVLGQHGRPRRPRRHRRQLLRHATFSAEGKVESVDADGITISHGPVPALKWPAMTMGFGKPDPKAFADVKPATRSASSSGRAGRWATSWCRCSESGAPSDRRAHPLVGRQPLPGADRHRLPRRGGALVGRQARRSTRCPTCRDTQVIVRTTYPGKPPAGGRGPGHLPADDDDAERAGREDRARLLVLRRLVRLRAVRRQDRSVLGALARGRVPQPGAEPAACRRDRGARARTPPASAGSTSTRWSTARGKHDLGQLRALNDWFLKFELKTVPDVAEVASIGGMVRQYQVVLDPDRMRALGITQAHGDGGAAEGQPGVRRLGRRDWPRPSTWSVRAAS